jgi:transcriptional regulator GlxA family with amidase domain
MRDRAVNSLFGVVIYDGVEPIDIGGTVGVLSMARRVLPRVESVTIAERRGSVVLAGGLEVMAQASFADAPTCDRLIVCGGPGWRTQVKTPAMLDFLRKAPSRHIASVCTGALILGAAGVLDGHTATTRRMAVGAETIAPLAALEEMAPKARGVPAAVVEDGPVVTGGGVSLAIDATLYLLGQVYGEAAAAEVAAVIEYDRAYAANKAALGHFKIG